MAVTEASIWFDYRKAMEQAGRLDEIADRLESPVRTGLEDGLSIAAASWKGDSAKRFQGKGRRLDGEIGAAARSIRAAAEEARAVARRMLETELANLALVQERTYQ